MHQWIGAPEQAGVGSDLFRGSLGRGCLPLLNQITQLPGKSRGVEGSEQHQVEERDHANGSYGDQNDHDWTAHFDQLAEWPLVEQRCGSGSNGIHTDIPGETKIDLNNNDYQ